MDRHQGADKYAEPYIGDILEVGFARAQAVVVMLTGDDEARLRDEFHRSFDSVDEKELRHQPRPNVLFEAGMSMAKFPQATVLVQIGELRGMSDILGRHILRMDGSLKARTELARALRKAGCTVDMETDTAWHTAGRSDTRDARRWRVGYPLFRLTLIGSPQKTGEGSLNIGLPAGTDWI